MFWVKIPQNKIAHHLREALGGGGRVGGILGRLDQNPIKSTVSFMGPTRTPVVHDVLVTVLT